MFPLSLWIKFLLKFFYFSCIKESDQINNFYGAIAIKHWHLLMTTWNFDWVEYWIIDFGLLQTPCSSSFNSGNEASTDSREESAERRRKMSLARSSCQNSTSLSDFQRGSSSVSGSVSSALISLFTSVQFHLVTPLECTAEGGKFDSPGLIQPSLTRWQW